MTWFKVDDGFYDHPKFLDVPNAAVGLWAKCGAWCGKHLTDGVVPASKVSMMRGTKAQVDALVSAGIWEVTTTSSGAKAYYFCNWNDFQPTKEQKQKEREESAERQRKSREKKAREQAKQENVTCDSRESHTDLSQRPDPPRPDPTRPDPLTPSGVNGEAAQARPARKRATRLPEGWMPDREVVEAMRAECPYVDLEAEHRKFGDYWVGLSGQRATKADWNATWRNWIRRAGENTPARASGRPAAARSWFDLAAEPACDSQPVLDANVIEIGEL